MMKAKIYSIIVSYLPNQHSLLRLCSRLVADGSKVIIVDNTEEPYLNVENFPVECKIISLGLNTGIAHAQNKGIQEALGDGAEVIVFFDQDSTIIPRFLRRLTLPLRLGTPDMVAPLCVDDISNDEYASVRVGKYGKPIAIYRGNTQEPYEVDVVISSGMAATREVFQTVGMLDEGLFIDFVDTEWCLRCRSRGVPIRVVPAAIMKHRIGIKSIRIGRFSVLVHTPERCYFQLRNCFHLLRMSHVPFLFALCEAFSVFLNRIVLLVIVPRRLDYLKAYLFAIRDGLVGVKGPRRS